MQKKRILLIDLEVKVKHAQGIKERMDDSIESCCAHTGQKGVDVGKTLILMAGFFNVLTHTGQKGEFKDEK